MLLCDETTACPDSNRCKDRVQLLKCICLSYISLTTPAATSLPCQAPHSQVPDVSEATSAWKRRREQGMKHHPSTAEIFIQLYMVKRTMSDSEEINYPPKEGPGAPSWCVIPYHPMVSACLPPTAISGVETEEPPLLYRFQSSRG